MFLFIAVEDLMLYLMVVNFCGVQTFMNFMKFTYPQKITKLYLHVV